MGVAVFVTSFDAGGTERQMLELVQRLDPERFRVHMACFDRRGPWTEWAASAGDRGVSIAEFPLRGFRHPSTAAALVRFARWCARRRLDVVQTAGLHANIFGLAGAALARVPLRVGSRRNVRSPAHSPALHRLQRHAYGLAHYVVANSEAADRALRREGVARHRIAMIPNGIDLAGRPVCAIPGAPRVVVVANLREEKGHDVLIDAAARVLAVRPDVVFELVGDGPLRQPLEAEVERRGLTHALRFLGHRGDIPELLASAGVFALPSRSEAMPNAVLEAMAARLPIVASEVGGVPELIRDGRTGLLVRAGDAHALAEALLALLRDPARAQSLGSAARAAVERFTFERMVSDYQRLYLSAIRQRAGIGPAKSERRVRSVHL